jgi:hypothetical protein
MILNEIVSLQQSAYQKYGAEMLVHLEQNVLPLQMGPGAYVAQYIQLLRGSNPKEFRDFFRSVVAAYRKEKLKL